MGKSETRAETRRDGYIIGLRLDRLTLTLFTLIIIRFYSPLDRLADRCCTDSPMIVPIIEKKPDSSPSPVETAAGGK